MKYYHADAANQPVGPFDLDAIRALAASGKLPADPMVHAEGSTVWVPLSSLEDAKSSPEAAAEPSAGSGFAEKLKSVNSSVLSDIVARILDLSRSLLKPSFIGTALNKARDLGHYVVLASAALLVITALLAAIKDNQFAHVPMGIAYLVLLIIAQFTAQSFLGAGEKLIQNSNSRVATPAFLDCFAMLSLAVAAIALFGGILLAVRMETFSIFLSGLLFAILFTFVAGQMLHPQLVNVEIGDATAGEEAIGLLTLFMKVGLKLVPLFFFLYATLGALTMILGFFNKGYALVQMVSFAPWIGYGTPIGFAGATMVIFACLVPLASYFGFLVLYVAFDLTRAVLSLPGKLDALRNR